MAGKGSRLEPLYTALTAYLLLAYQKSLSRISLSVQYIFQLV